MNNSGIVRADSGTPVKFPGTAVLSESAAPDAGVPATIRVISENGVRRVLTATTDAFSRFTATFLPLPNEAGSYRFAAAHPTVAENVVQGRFELVGMRAEPGGAALRIIPGSPLAGSINLRNLGDVDLTGLSVTVLDAPPNVVLTADLDGDRLPGHGVARLSYTALAVDASVSRASARLRVTSAEGASTDLVFELRVERLAPRLVADEGPLIVGVVRGRQRVVSLQVRNLGGAATGPLRALLPSADLPWLGLASGTTIPSLAPGQSTAVTLTVTPPSDAPLGRYEGTIALRDHPARHRGRERAGEERVDDPRAHPSEALRGRFQNPGLPLQADADLRDPRRLRDIWRVVRQYAPREGRHGGSDGAGDCLRLRRRGPFARPDRQPDPRGRGRTRGNRRQRRRHAVGKPFRGCSLDSIRTGHGRRVLAILPRAGHPIPQNPNGASRRELRRRLRRGPHPDRPDRRHGSKRLYRRPDDHQQQPGWRLDRR